MKTNLTRQNMYILASSIILLIFVLVFSFAVLIPKGKEYRVKRTEVKKESLELKQLSNFFDETEEILKKLQSDNIHIIKAFENDFSAQRFEKQHKSFFNTLRVSQRAKLADEDGFTVYEVNTTSQIDSPQNFYNFLDAVNKSDWIIAVNFPIDFKRDKDIISSSFTMRVYSNSKESNSSRE